MKWLFAILVALNLIVFAAMIGVKLLNRHMPVADKTAPAQPAQQQQPTQVIINTANPPAVNGQNTAPAAAGTGAVVRRTVTPTPATPAKTQPAAPKARAEEEGGSRSQKSCSARVSIPEDDYHRIKGLLSSYPHAAARQVVENKDGGNGQTASRMNVVFMSLDDQQAAAVQSVVGRYGQLSRSPCNK